MKKKRVIMSRIVDIKHADRSFDLEFWHKVGPEGRFSAAWDLIKEDRLIRGKNVRQPRLQRSVQNIKRTQGQKKQKADSGTK